MHPLCSILYSETIAGYFTQDGYQSSRAQQKMWLSRKLDPAWMRLQSTLDSRIRLLA